MSAPKRAAYVLVDANVFLRIFVRENETMFADCHSFFQAIKSGSIDAYIPTVIAAEVSFVLSSHYKLSKPAILQALESMGASSGLKILDDLQMSLGIALYKSHTVKLIDCLLASSKRIQEGNAVILSYDRDFDKLGIRRLEPRDILKRSPFH
ncbi:MAG: hypothetical protein UY08_C0006G0007 [Candidatus Gottesmanbacteria bacterium GW2011_GWA1_47_8]|uniref:PIN domain-containing protein n=3 Tax=Candidatus Gottesmaniibacteriota TaxID=1752720 RepID=A0A0G1TGM7_9BACT|nr:MAG: hypothetical protein UY08_C0006G0007 [Candidatus Gottesmanbacteria bacterium GW2011_GWA1_47_8]